MKRILGFISLVMVLCMLFPIVQAPIYATTINNINATDTEYKKAENALKTLKIFMGYPNGTMGENKKITRAEMATVAIRLLGLESGWETNYTVTKTYPDVAENHWAVKYLSKAHETALAVGDPDGNFRPDDDVTLVEAIKMILVAGGHGYDKDNKPLEWYEGYKKVAKELKMLDGVTCGDNEAVSRGAIILMVYKMLLSDVTMPEASLEEGTYTGIQKIQLSTNVKNAKIYYTLDGSEPNSKSNEYKSSIIINETTTLKAITVKDCVLFSDVLTVKYKIEDVSKTEKNTNNSSYVPFYPLPFIPPSSSQSTYSLTVVAGNGGTVNNISGSYPSGTVVTLTAIPSNGYKFINWTSSNNGIFESSTNSITTFTMPSNNVTITANFQAIDQGNSDNMFNLTSSVEINRFTLSGTISCENNISCILYQVYSSDRELLTTSPKVYKYNINANNIDISLSDIMTFDGTNYVKVIVEYENGNQEEKIYTLNNNFGIHESPALTESDIVRDDGSYTSYARNQLIIIFRNGVTYNQALDFITNILDSTILGYSEAFGRYTIKITHNFENLVELEDFANELKEKYDGSILGAFPNYVNEGISIEAVPNDTEWDTWKDTPDIGDRQWGLEAIKTPYAWNYNYYMQYVPIGIIDSGVDYTHEDITISSIINKEAADHGTHVAGIIGAIPNNNKGITGISWKSRLYNVAVNSEDMEITATILDNLEKLILLDIKVINVSLGRNYQKNYVYPENLSPEDTEILVKSTVNRDRQSYTYIMENLIDERGYDFLIIQAAGNDGQKTGKYPVQQLAANNGYFASITDERYMSHIMIIGAATNEGNGKYSLAEYSNYGDRVDVIAPGTEIYSTIVNSYGFKRGTSMAAPHVTGTAAMMLSVNPNLKAIEIKQILMDTANIPVLHSFDDVTSDTYTTHNMINAEEAVKEAFNRRNSNTTGVVSGKIRSIITNQAIENATLVFRYDTGDKNSAIIGTATTDSNGFYSIDLPIGTYRVFVSATGFESFNTYDIEYPYTISIEMDRGYIYTTVLHPKVGGNGTIVNPYQISTPEQLRAIENDTTAHYILVNDIDLGDYDWQPISTLSGSLDGFNYEIKNLKITGDTNQGLFVSLTGTIKNLSIVNGYITGKSYVGGFCGQNYGIIQNCSFSGEILAGEGFVGGFTGFNNGTIAYCKNSGSITVGNSSKYPYAEYYGGIAGYNIGDNGIIEQCFNTGTIGDINLISAVGGICGWNDGKISNCFNINLSDINEANVYGYGSAGGISGVIMSGGIIENCYNAGRINSRYYPGNGIISSYPANNSIGVSNCYNVINELPDDLHDLLGEPFVRDIYNVNNGYPIFLWMLQ